MSLLFRLCVESVAYAAPARLGRRLSFTGGDLLWQPKPGPAHDVDRGDNAKHKFTRPSRWPIVQPKPKVATSSDPIFAVTPIPDDVHAPWNKKWRNSIAICATMRQENVTDVVEWLTYYRCVPSQLIA